MLQAAEHPYTPHQYQSHRRSGQRGTVEISFSRDPKSSVKTQEAGYRDDPDDEHKHLGRLKSKRYEILRIDFD
ncbi:hypothetical protein HMSSN139_42990 [Paenibacillus sp. HMSSN-139]|nr:hypothetical protein HMSSN139_42990 [Paenibacillus sp. HMSSN-139]